MEARTGTATRRVRAIAIVAVLLCGFAVLAPLIARSAGAEHPRIHLAKLVNPAGADQNAATSRVDHAVAVALAPRQPAQQIVVAGPAESVTAPQQSTTDSVRTRGPPAS